MSDYAQIIDVIAAAFGIVGVGVVVAGFVASVIQGMRLRSAQGASAAYAEVRSTFGRGLLLGLELLVAGDIIRTVAVQPAIGNLAILGLLVVIRTFLAWSLEVEIDGRWPWTRAAAEAKERSCQNGAVGSTDVGRP